MSIDTQQPPAGTRVAPTSKAIHWPIVALLMALCFISHLNRISMSVAGDERIMSQFAIDPKKMGTIYSAFLLVYTIFMIPGGFFIDRFGPRAALAVMGLGSAAFCALTGVAGLFSRTAAQVWISLLVIRGVMGLVTTPLHPGAARAVGLWTAPEKRTLVNGLVTGSALLGIACTYKIFGSLIDRVGWPKAFLMTSSITAWITLLWLVVARGRGQESPSSGPTTDWQRLLTNRSLILLTLSYAAIGYFQYLFFYWLQYYFDHVLALGKDASRYYAGIPALAMAFAMPLGGWIVDALIIPLGRRKARAMVSLNGMVVAAALVICGVMSKNTFWIVLWFSLAMAAAGLSEGAFWSTAVELGGRMGGTAASIMNVGGNGIGLLAPVVTPWVAEQLHWHAAIMLGALVCILGGLCWLWIDPEENRYEQN